MTAILLRKSLYAGAVICALATTAWAECVKEPRTVRLSKGSRGTIEAYRCSSGDTALRVEFLRLSDITAPLLLKRQSSKHLRKMFGEPRLVDNDVSKTYNDLVSRFGETEDLASLGMGLRLSDKEDAEVIEDTLDVKKLRTLRPPEQGVRPWPAATEIAELQNNSVPASLAYFYELDGCQEASRFCRKIGDQFVGFMLWRSLTAQDMESYKDSVTLYNAQTLKARPKARKDEMWSTSVPRYLRMAQFLAAEGWPKDWVIITGGPDAGICGSDEAAYLKAHGDWGFEYSARTALLDAILIENVAKSPASIDSLLGESVVDKTLRVALPTAPEAQKRAAIQNISLSLAPQQKLLVPTRIIFSALPDDRAEFERYRPIMDKAPALFEATKLKIEKDRHREIPEFKDYVYGPELAVTGLLVNSTRLDFTKSVAASKIEFTATAEVGSCPHLLSLDVESGEWVHHGKILHEASEASKASVDARAMEGLRTRFRLEEREPERALIKSASLLLKLDDGSVVRLAPLAPIQEHELLLGDGMEIEFAAPEPVRGRVVQSTIQIEGYYERYSRLASSREDREREKVCRPQSR